MTVSDRRDVVVSVEIAAPFFIVEPYALASDDVDWMIVKQPITRAK